MTMSQVEMLEQTVKQLSPGERAAFRSWFIEFDAAEWDRQIEMDSETGKLDRLVQSAVEEYKAGKTKSGVLSGGKILM
jgi:hypothetical protein